MDLFRGVYHSEDVIPVVYQCEYESLGVQHIEDVLWCLPVWGCHPTDDGRTQSVWRRAAHWSLVWTSTTLTLHLPHTTLHLPQITLHLPHIIPYLPHITLNLPNISLHFTFHQPLLTSHHLQTPLSSYLLIYWIHSIIRLRGLRASPYFSISQWNRHILDLYYYQYPFSYPHTLYLQSFIFLSTLMRNSNWIYFISSLLMSVLRIEFKYNQKTLKSVCRDNLGIWVLGSGWEYSLQRLGIHRETSRQMISIDIFGKLFLSSFLRLLKLACSG